MTNKISVEEVREYLEGATLQSTKLGEKTTMLFAKFKNGYEVVVSSACVNPEDYDNEVGEKIAYGKLVDKTWELLGFLAHKEETAEELVTDPAELLRV